MRPYLISTHPILPKSSTDPDPYSLIPLTLPLLISIPSLMVIVLHQLSCFSWNPAKLPPTLGPLIWEWCYSGYRHSSNLLSLKTLFKCHLLREATLLKCQLTPSLLSSFIFLFWSTYRLITFKCIIQFIHYYVYYMIWLPTFPHWVWASQREGSVFVIFTVLQYSLCCLHIVST